MAITRRRFVAGNIIFREGEPPGKIYLVVKGKVQLVKNGSKKEVVIDQIGRNAVFGEMAVIDKCPRSATAIAITETECYELDHAGFEEQLKALSPFMRGIFRVVVKRLRHTTTQLTANKSLE